MLPPAIGDRRGDCRGCKERGPPQPSAGDERLLCRTSASPTFPLPPKYAPGVSVLNVWVVSLEKDGLEDRVS